MVIRRRLLQVISIVIILSMLVPGTPIKLVSAQAQDGLRGQVNSQTRKVSFIEPESGTVLPASAALGISPATPLQDPGMALLKRFGPEFGVKDPERDLSEARTNHRPDGRLTVHYQQNYRGVPVIGGELIVNTDVDGALYSMNGEVSPKLLLSTQPTFDPKGAKQIALRAAAKWYQKASEDFLVSEPELWIYDESLLRASSRPAELVWRMEVTPKEVGLPVRELVLVNAEKGSISLHFNQIDTAWKTFSKKKAIPTTRESSSTRLASVSETTTGNFPALAFAPVVRTYTSGSTTSLPGSFLCNQTDPNCVPGDSHARAAHKYAIGTYNLYAAQFGRDSIDNHGMTIVSSVHYCDFFYCPYPNAYWSGTQMVYGDEYGFPLADDVVAHELNSRGHAI